VLLYGGGNFAGFRFVRMIVNADIRARFGQRNRDGAADTSARSRDNCGFTGKFHDGKGMGG
jgi:hypothetical protein